MPRQLDPMWKYGIPKDGKDRQRLNCDLCRAYMSGGVHRLKHHLAKIPGHDVGPCPNVTPEIMRAAFDSLEAYEQKKAAEAANKAEQATFVDMEVEGPSERGSTAAKSYFVPRSGPGSQPGIKSVINKKAHHEAKRVMARCIFWSDLPLTITRNNPYWQKMCDAIAVAGPWFKTTSYD